MPSSPPQPQALLALIALAALAGGGGCKGRGDHKGPVIARVGDDVITADDLKRQLDQVSPFLRGRYDTVERKKEFLENLIRNELLAQEAARRGLDKAPQVREQLKRAMVQELLRRQLDERLAGGDLADAELRKFYDLHLDDFVKPERARVSRILLAAPPGDAAARAAARRRASALRQEIDQRARKGEANAFQAVALKRSQDPSSAPLGGDLRFLSREEMAKGFSPQLADAAFALKSPGDEAGPIETPQGIELVRLQARTAALERTFEQAKDAIRGRVARERRSRDYDEFVRKLREDGRVTIDEGELARVSVADALPQPSASPAAGPAAPAPSAAGR